MASASGKSATKSKLAEGAPLKISGNFVKDVLQTPSSAISLVATVGEGDAGAFLVPFGYLSIFETIDGGVSEILGAFVPLESAAYLLADMTGELATSVDRLEDMASARLPLEPTRLKAMREYVENARKGLDELAAGLDRLITAPAK